MPSVAGRQWGAVVSLSALLFLFACHSRSLPSAAQPTVILPAPTPTAPIEATATPLAQGTITPSPTLTLRPTVTPATTWARRPTITPPHALAKLAPTPPTMSVPLTDVVRVPGDWATIQSAIEGAPPGATIQVGQGIYGENLRITRTVTLEGGWNISFTARAPLTCVTTIDGQHTGSVLSITGAVSPTIEGFWIVGGESQNGGGAYVEGASPLLIGNVFSGNVALADGGGLYVRAGDADRVVVRGNRFVGNSAGRGGGIAASSETVGQVAIDANEVLSNVATAGGGIYLGHGAPLSLTNNVVACNSASGVAVEKGAWLVNNTLVANTSAGLEARVPISGRVMNTIVVSHTVGISLVAGSQLTVGANLFWQNGQNYAGVAPSAKDLVADPDLAPGFRLRLCSPAVDRGLDWVAPPTDIDGDPRPVGRVDIGADEVGDRLLLPHVANNHPFPQPLYPFGVAIFPTWAVTEEVAYAQQANVAWVRINLFWDEVEPVKTTPRTYHWEPVDARVLSATQAGLQPILVLGGNPAWAAPFPGGPVTDTADIREFLAAGAERYDGDGFQDAPGSSRVEVWEMYNEPDNWSAHYRTIRGWGYWGDQPEAYAEFLALASEAIKGVDPSARVAFGGLAHEAISGDVFNMDFPDQIFQYIQDHPGRQYFDLFTFHFFPPFAFQYEAWGPDVIGKTEYFRAKMSAYGLEWPVMVTEAGLWSYAAPIAPESPWAGSFEHQARYVPQLYARGMAAGIEAVLWLLMSDRLSPSWHRGLLNDRLEPKPAFNAYQQATRKLEGLEFVRALSEEELGTKVAEGYVFARPDGSQPLYLIWTTGVETATARLAAERVLVSDKVSGEWPMEPEIPYFDPLYIDDGDDGLDDGWVTISYGEGAIYIEPVEPSRALEAG